jgi:P-type E1-E2 ATPase
LKNLDRHEIEKECCFLGLLVFENPMKEGSDEVIENLNLVNISSVMVTGDNYLTALKVS